MPGRAANSLAGKAPVRDKYAQTAGLAAQGAGRQPEPEAPRVCACLARGKPIRPAAVSSTRRLLQGWGWGDAGCRGGVGVMVAYAVGRVARPGVVRWEMG
jgi:hypothetical protein